MNDSKVLDRLRILRQTGDLWSISWWEDDKYFKDGKILREEAKSAFSELKTIFNNKWGRKYVVFLENEQLSKCHPLFLWLSGEGPYYFQYFLYLGNDLHTLRTNKLLNKELINRLMNKDNFTGAEFEVRILAHFIREGFEIKRDFPSGKGNKNCDIRVSMVNGKTIENVFIEITRPEDVCYENKERYKEGINQLQKSLKAENEELINNSLKEFDKGKYAISAEAEIKKLTSKIEEKAGQLPDDGPGLIIIYTPMALTPRSSMRLFESEINLVLNNLPSVSAVVLFEGYYIAGHGIHYQNNVFLNSAATIDISNLEIIKVIENFSGSID